MRPVHTTPPCYDLPVSPAYYTQGDIECKDALRSMLGHDGYIAYCRGAVIKYAWRCNEKGGLDDIDKAIRYLEFIKEEGL